MRTITTSKGESYEAEYCFAPSLIDGGCAIRLRDSRKLPEIAAEFDGLTAITLREDENETVYAGYTRLGAINAEGGMVNLRLFKE